MSVVEDEIESPREARARARRKAAREREHARWSRPIEDLRDRLSAWTHMLAVDHGFIRLVHRNRHRVDEMMWRSSQPAPHDLAWAARKGIRTVVTLRAGRPVGSWPLQREACERHGLELVELPLYSRAPPTREAIHAARRAFDEIAYPALMHCKAGADRAGIASALYLLMKRGLPVEVARRQLDLRFGHVSSAKTGVLGVVLDAYRVEGAAHGLSFLDWVDTRYDPDAIAAAYRPTLWTDLLVDRIIRRE